MSTLAEHHPDLAARLGLNVETVARDGEFLGKLCIVTFREPMNPSATRRDPIAFLPPDYQRFGIVDRSGLGKVQPGETWIVRPTTTAVGAIFLTPLAQIELGTLLALDSRFVSEIVQELARNRVDLLQGLRDYLPKPQETVTAPTPQMNALQAENGRLKTALMAADQALALAEQLPIAITEARQSARELLAPAQVEVEIRPAEAMATLPLYVADANLFINAGRNNWAQCHRILDSAGIRFRLAVTRQVFDELRHSYRMPNDLEVLEVPTISQELRELAVANAHALGKKAGTADLSLIQALLENPKIRGIITEDPDVHNMHPESIVRKMTGREVECVTSGDFCQRHKKLVA
jgi:hypothetical protein